MALSFLILAFVSIWGMDENQNTREEANKSKKNLQPYYMKLSSPTKPNYINAFLQFIHSTRLFKYNVKDSIIPENAKPSPAITLLKNTQVSLDILRNDNKTLMGTLPSFDGIMIKHFITPTFPLASEHLGDFVQNFIFLLKEAWKEIGDHDIARNKFLFGRWNIIAPEDEEKEFPFQRINPVFLSVGRNSFAEELELKFFSRVDTDLNSYNRNIGEILPFYLFTVLVGNDFESRQSRTLLPFFHPTRNTKVEKNYAYIAHAFFYKSEISRRYKVILKRSLGWMEFTDENYSPVVVTNEMQARIEDEKNSGYVR